MPPGVRRRGRAGAAGGGGSGDSTHIICMAEARRISHLCKYMMLPPCISADKSCRSDGRIRLGYFCGVAAIQLRGACNVYGGEVRVRKMQWPARLEGPARIAAVCGKVSYSLGSARYAF